MEYNVDGLKERTLKELREWADPGYNNWEYASDSVRIISAPDTPPELYQEMVKVWAQYAMEKCRFYREDFHIAAYTVRSFGAAVQEEITRRTGEPS